MSFSTYLDIMYTDKLTITRYIEIKNEDGTTGEAKDESLDLKDIPCHISSQKMDERSRNWDTDQVEASVKIFLSPKTKIFKGDRVEADRYIGGIKVQSYHGYAGDPLIYDLAQEFMLLEKRVKEK